MGRGIAAVVDAIFLLVIAAIASGIVLSAAANYGKSFQQESQKLLLNYYAKQVVRTLVTASVEREPGVPDYLLAYVKEAVENLNDLGSAEVAFEETVRKAMEPIAPRFDYAVLLDGRGTSWNTVYMFYKYTDETGNVEENVIKYEGDFDALDEWFNGIGPEVYASSTTIFMRYCVAGGDCSYIPVKIRVVIFPEGGAGTPP